VNYDTRLTEKMDIGNFCDKTISFVGLADIDGCWEKEMEKMFY